MTAEQSGGLPPYICEIARAIKRSGKTTSSAISIAVSRAKVWASGGGDVDADTRAKAAKAVAQWEALKAKSKAKSAGKSASHVVAASSGLLPSDVILYLTAPEYNVEIVRAAFEDIQRKARDEHRRLNPDADKYYEYNYLYIQETWSTFLIVRADYRRHPTMFKIPYAVDSDQNVTFGAPIEVKTEYIAAATAELGDRISDADLMRLLGFSNLAKLSRARGPSQKDPLELLLAAQDPKKPYGDVTYADLGYQEDGKNRYPLDSEEHCRAAQGYINQADNAAKYPADKLKLVKGKISKALKKYEGSSPKKSEKVIEAAAQWAGESDNLLALGMTKDYVRRIAGKLTNVKGYSRKDRKLGGAKPQDDDSSKNVGARVAALDDGQLKALITTTRKALSSLASTDPARKAQHSLHALAIAEQGRRHGKQVDDRISDLTAQMQKAKPGSGRYKALAAMLKDVSKIDRNLKS